MRPWFSTCAVSLGLLGAASALVLAQVGAIFRDGFESGDRCRWSNATGCVHEVAPSLCAFPRPAGDQFRIRLTVSNEHGQDTCTTPPFERATWDFYCGPGACVTCEPPEIAFDCTGDTP